MLEERFKVLLPHTSCYIYMNVYENRKCNMKLKMQTMTANVHIYILKKKKLNKKTKKA